VDGIGRADLARLPSGIDTLDSLTGGGIPSQSLSVLTGPPGTGKTVLAMQILFAQAREGKRCLYFTTLSEPAIKLIRYVQQFSFFDSALIDDRVSFIDLGTTLLSANANEVLAAVRARLEDEEPDFVVLDSFKAIHDLIGNDPSASRSLAYELAVTLAGWGTTTLLLGEYTPEQVTVLPEFAIADGIVQLSNERQGLTRLRQFEILKLRGADYVAGVHFFQIRPDGVHFYPRVRNSDADHEYETTLKPVPTGLAGLDEMLRGGLPLASTTLLEGGTGSGKTLLSLRFLITGAEQGEPGIHFGLEEDAPQIRAIARNLGWSLEPLEATGLLTLHHTAPVELNPDQFLGDAMALIRTVGAKRVVFDSSTSLSLGVDSEARFRQLLYALSGQLRTLGVTSIYTAEVAELLGSTQLSGRGISPITDNVILLRYVEIAGRLDRAISVLKARGVAHDTGLRRYSIESNGPAVGDAFTDLRKVLTGLPEVAAL
jgi:circadian clock protein KaiC